MGSKTSKEDEAMKEITKFIEVCSTDIFCTLKTYYIRTTYRIE